MRKEKRFDFDGRRKPPCKIVEVEVDVNTTGMALRRMREAAGMTLGQAARHLGISVTRLSAFERGKPDPTVKSKEQP